MRASSHHYLFDAVPLLDDCIDKLHRTIDQDSRSRHDALYDMKEVLVHTEGLLHQYLDQMIRKESRGLTTSTTTPSPSHANSCDIQQTLFEFQRVLGEKRNQETINQGKIRFLNPQEDPTILLPAAQQHHQPNTSHTLYTNRSATDSLLFRLIVALQLCLLRIDDAHFVITGRRMANDADEQHKRREERQVALSVGAGCCCLVGAGVVAISWSNRGGRVERGRWMKEFLIVSKDRDTWIRTLTSVAAAMVAGRVINTQWKKLWMRDKLFKSTCEIDEWTQQWETVQTTVSPRSHHEQLRQERFRIDLQRQNSPSDQPSTPELMDDKSRRLIEYAMKNNPKSYFWQSQGEIRFLMLKRFMDVYYASVGTAIDSSSSSPSATWIVPLITGAAASFYSITGTGASVKASHAVNHASRDLIQHAWYAPIVALR
jgi:hypothetical protein